VLVSIAYWSFAPELPGSPGGSGIFVSPDRSATREHNDVRVSDARDDGWVQAIRAGDRNAFTALYKEYLPAMIGFAVRLVGSASVAEDVVADVFTRVWQRRHEWHPVHGARAYLFRAVRTRSLDVLRHARTVQRTHDESSQLDESLGVAAPAPGADVHLDSETILAAVDAAVAAMPAMRRQVMELRWQHGLSIEEVAAVVGVSRAAVDQHLSRGLQLLRRLLPEIVGR
jgi:RNA polymerase sigma-70 factor (ECF subfamily)